MFFSKSDLDTPPKKDAFFLLAQSTVQTSSTSSTPIQTAHIYSQILHTVYFGVQCLAQGHLGRWADTGNLCKCFSPSSVLFFLLKNHLSWATVTRNEKPESSFLWGKKKQCIDSLGYAVEPYFPYSKESFSAVPSNWTRFRFRETVKVNRFRMWLRENSDLPKRRHRGQTVAFASL